MFSLIMFMKVLLCVLKVNIYLKAKKCVKRVFPLFFCVCAACLPASWIVNVPISELHTRWHWCLHVNSIQRSCWWQMLILVWLSIRQNFFPVSPSSRTSQQLSYDHVQVFHRQTFLSYRQEFMFEMRFHENTENGWTF